LRWLAPEGIKLGKFSVASDVYAYGVLVFEVFSFGAFPFSAFADNMAFIGFLAGLNQRGGAGNVDPVSVPLIKQLATCLNKYKVHAVPLLIEELLRECVVREPTKRLTFGLIAKKTNRSAAGRTAVAGLSGDDARGAVTGVTSDVAFSDDCAPVGATVTAETKV
jgi:serine/threonine protein kinase